MWINFTLGKENKQNETKCRKVKPWLFLMYFGNWNSFILSQMMRCTIWYYLYNFKNVKNTHGGVSILVKLKPATLLKLNFTKINTPSWVFLTFFKLYKWYQIVQRTTYANHILILAHLWIIFYEKKYKVNKSSEKKY